jgi:hypothetical protein
MIKDFYNKYKLTILGCVLFITYFWLRFLRERLPKDLPLNLSIFGLLILIYICCIFLYILISLLRKPRENPTLEKIIDWLLTPLKEFDKFIKSISFISSTNEALTRYIVYNWDLIINNYMKIFHIIMWIIPHLILVIALSIDVYIFHVFYYKYTMISFGLLLLLNRYIRYSLRRNKDMFIAHLTPFIDHILTDYYPGVHPSELEPDYDPNDPDNDEYIPTMALPFDIFIKYQTESILYRETQNSRRVFTTKLCDSVFWKEETNQELPENLTREESKYLDKIIEKHLYAYIDYALQLSLVIEYYNYINTKNKRFKNLKILIYLNYFLCWFYVLIISLPTLHDFSELYLALFSIQDYIEPFSELSLFLT